MTFILLGIALIWPLLHIQFGKLHLAKTRQKFDLRNWETIKFMWTGSLSSILIFGALSIIDLSGFDLQFGVWAAVFGFMFIILIYELYIQSIKE